MGKYAIFIVSALIFSMLTYTSALRNALSMSNTRTVESYSINQAQNIAQGAMMIAISEIRNNESSSFHPVKNSSYAYPSTNGFTNWEEMHGEYNLLISNQDDTLYVVRSTGRFEDSRYITTVGLVPGGISEWDAAVIDQALHAESDINLGNGSIEGDVTLNSPFDNLEIKKNGLIDGDFHFYDEGMEPGQVEDEDGIEGHVVNRAERDDYPDPVFPDFPIGNLPVIENGNQSYMAPEDYEGYQFLDFSTSNMTIDVGDQDRVLHVKDIDLSGSISISGEGSLSIYVEESLNLGNGNINTLGSAEKLTIYYKGTDDISYTGNGTFSGLLFSRMNDVSVSIGGTPNFKGHIISYGDEIILHGNPTNAALVYAPYATVTQKGTAGSFRGAIVADRYVANGKPDLVYDAEFASTLPELKQEGGGEYSLLYWN